MNQQSAAHDGPGRRGLAGWTTWLAGLVVALGAVGATAHGLYVVALAAGAPQPIAWLYPLITDGLALVAYACTAQLTGRGRRYAWTVVVLAAGLSGLAQASYLAGGVTSAPPELRFGVGAWPAVAAAIVAHLLFLIGTAGRAGQPNAVQSVQPDHVQSVQPDDVQSVQPRLLNSSARSLFQPITAVPSVQSVQRSAGRGDSPASDRASGSAYEHRARHGEWPTVTQLMHLATVSRGTAGAVLQDLRQTATAVTSTSDQRP